MPWQPHNSGGGGPWGGGPGGGPWGRGGGFGGGRPPDFDDFIRKSQDRFTRLMSGGAGGGRGILLIIAVLLGVWMLSGFYRVLPDEQGVVLRFGQWVNTTQPGLNWHLPYPIETVETPSVERIYKIDIGFESFGIDNGSTTERDIEEESLMLTGDQNIIDIDFTVQWKVSDAGKFLFNIRDPEATVKIAAESAMREIIGRTDIQPALTEARGEIQRKTRELLQTILTDYGAGIDVLLVQLQNVQPPPEVIDAFNDVQRALQDRDRQRNEADAYRNAVLPRARGEAQRILQEAQAYQERVVNEAEGEGRRFVSVYDAYKQNPDLTKRRLYLETLQRVLSDTDKVIMNRGVEGAVPYLPLNELRNKSGTRAGSQPGRTQAAN